MASADMNRTSSPMVTDSDGNHIVPCIIDNKPIIQPSSSNFPVTSSRQEKIIHYGQNVTRDIATQAVESAAKAWKTYKKTPVYKRRQMLLRAADLFDQKTEECIYRQMLETSCDYDWAKLNVSLTVDIIREIAAAVEVATTGAVTSSYHGNTNIMFKEPVGTALLIPP